MKRASLRVWPALLCALLGCKSLPFPEPHLEGPYGELIKAHTREFALYGGLETRAFAQLVYLSPDMIDAQARLVSDMRGEPPAEQQQTLLRLRGAASTPTFFAIVRTPTAAWNDWEVKDSVWRVACDFGNGQFLPEKVDRIERPFNAELQKVYPYLDEYSVAYTLHFPAAAVAAGAKQPVITVDGALGHMRFDWTAPQKE